MKARKLKNVILTIFLILIVANAGIGIAESNPMEIGLLFLNQAMDLEEIETFTSNTPEYGEDELNFWFDFRDGWHLVMVLHNGKLTSTMPMDDVKILNGLCNLLPLFPQIQAEMPERVEVSFTIAFTDKNRLLVTEKNFSNYSWY